MNGAPRNRPGFLQGPELTRIAVLSVMLVAGIAAILAMRQRAQERPAPHTAAAAIPLPPADPSADLQGIQDRSPVNARDTAGYALLAERARTTSDADLRSQARWDVVYSQLLEKPARYRGLPIHLEGIARRVLVQTAEGSKVFPAGQFFEVYVFTPDSQNNPYILTVDALPPGLSAGDQVDAQVVFDGYFFKLMAYLAGDGKYRAAPLLVGRLQLPAGTAATAANRAPGRSFPPWLLVLPLLLAAWFLARSLLGMRGRGTSGQRPWTRPQVTDQIAPEDLCNWLDKAKTEPTEDPDAPGSPPPIQL